MKFNYLKSIMDIANFFNKSFTCFLVILCLLLFNFNFVHAEDSQDHQNEEFSEDVEEVEQYQDDEGELSEEENTNDGVQEEEESNSISEQHVQDEKIEQVPQAQPFIDLSNNPASYSGKKPISIERSLKQKRLDKETTILSEHFSGKPCDPMVSLKVDQEKRFDVLSKLAEEHTFDISMLETENLPISIEKNQPLSEVVESITRKMNVVLNYQKVGDCKRLVSIAVLNDKEWAGSGGGVRSFSGSNSALSETIENLSGYNDFKGKVSRDDGEIKYKAFTPVRLEPKEKTQEEIEAQEQRREAYRKRVENNGGELLNDTLENGSQLKNDFSVKGNSWKIQQEEEIPDMEVYVQEVLNGDRVPNVRGMKPDDRKEYMRLRREYQMQQTEVFE